jgi:hypothetical protein
LGKLDGLVWHSGLSNFLILEASCPVAGRRSRNDHLPSSGFRGHNLQLVQTILGESVSVMEPMVCTTLPKVDTSSTEAPTARALAARLGSKVPDDNPCDDDLDLLNFAMVESWITS